MVESLIKLLLQSARDANNRLLHVFRTSPLAQAGLHLVGIGVGLGACGFVYGMHAETRDAYRVFI